ncbi:MAG: ice-binding family protein [Bacteroidales bacterium]
MKTRLINSLISVLLLLITNLIYAQAPPLGSAADYVVFTTVGAVGNTGISHITGNVGTNNGGITGFGNVNGVMTYTSDLKSAQAAADLLIAYNQLSSTVPAFFPASLLGNGDTLNAGVYSITGATTLNAQLTLNGQGNSNAVFIFKIQGPFSTAANSKIKLINGAQACNVFWKIEGLVDMASGTTMKGTVIANNAAINLSSGCSLEGRVLSTAGAVNVSGVLAYTPSGCGSPVLLGPLAPSLVSAACYTVFSSNGPVTNVGITNITGDIGTNSGLTTGFNPLFVTGAIHPIPDGSTTAAASDLLNAYSYLNILPYDIELLYPAQFGNQLVLTPHTYLINGATTFTDTLFLDAQGSANAIFVIKIYGALSTSTYSKVKMINGTQSKNVYWLVNGAVSINDYSEFVGTIVCNNGAMNLMTGVVLDGRALTTTGAVSTSAITAIMPPGCGLTSAPVITSEPFGKTVCAGDSVYFSVAATGTGLAYQWRKGSVNLLNGGHISGVSSDTLKIYPANLSDTSTNYNVIVSGSILPNDTSINVALIVKTASVITTEPINQTACIGSSVKFSVAASGTVLSYQWRKGNVNLINGGHISGATSDTLKINPMIISDTASNYNVIITGSCLPKDTSLNVSLLPVNAPVITVEPINKSVCAGNSISFSVTATGTALNYQWRKGTVNLINGGHITGATTALLSINPANISDTSSNYNVIVSGGCTPNDTSINASLVVNTSPLIITEPINKIACVGSLVNFSVLATGSGLTYQWRKGTVNLINGGSISGATSDTLKFNPMLISDTASNYNVIITGSCLPKDTSINVSLMPGTAPVITIEPVNKTACAGSSVNFSVTATGSVYSYQWRKGNLNLSNGGSISGATSALLTIYPVNISDTATNYNVIVTGGCVPNDTSVNASLVVNAATIITTEPVNHTVCAGSAVNISVNATGTSLTYQWRKGNVNLINGGNISGVTSDTLKINPVNVTNAASNYNVIVTGACTPNDTSINSSLVVNSSAIITKEPVNQTVCAGSSASFSVVSTGTGLTYQWRKGNVNIINGGNISGAASDTLKINPVNISDTASNYNVIVFGLCAINDTSINASLSVNAATVIITEPVSRIVCIGSPVSFSVVATGTGLTYQWRKGNINLINIGNVSGVTSDTLKINPVTISDTGSNYNVVVSGSCSIINSSIAFVNLKSAGNFGILAGVGISSTGFSVIHDMNIGISPGVRTSISGFPPATLVNGAIYASDDVAPPGVAAMLIQAKQDLTDAYLFAEGATAPAPITVAGDQGGLTLAPGIYKSTSTLLIQSGDLTLDAQGNANATWIFQIASDFTTVGGAGGNVILSGGAQAKNVTWQVGSSATIGNTTNFKGNILALTSITMNTGSTIDGRLLARNGAVVLSGTNIINNPSNSTTNTSNLTSTNVSLGVNLLPITSIITGNATPLCNAAAVVYSVVNTIGSTYLWTVPSGAIITSGAGTNSITVTFGTSNGNVSVVETNSNGCVGSQVVKPISLSGCSLNADFTANITSICSGSSVIFTSISTGTTIATTYSWSFGAGATPATATGIGPHTVTYSGSGSSTVSLTIIDGTTSVKTKLNYITITPGNTIVLTSAVGTNNQTHCINTAITTITYATTGATGASISSLPAGVTSSWLANVVTISGTPSAIGVYNYTVTLTGGCGTQTATGTITVIPNNTIVLTSLIGTNNQTKCINSAITNITYTTTGASGATFSGLPSGVTANWAANVVTISGTSTVSGIFSYTVNLTGGCGTISANGTITVSPNNTIVLSSLAGTNNQSRCINNAIGTITYTTTGATGVSFSGLPAGVTGNWSANVVTISGTPSASGVYNYTVTLTGNCGIITENGTITVTPDNTIVLTSVVGTNNQTKCINSAIITITYTTTGASGATFSGLPTGVTGSWLANVVTISGTPSVSGIYNYTVTLTGGCGLINTNGTITVSPNNTIVLSSVAGTNNQTRCINNAIATISYTTTGATGASISSLPAGVTSSWSANVVTISGTPTASGIFNYTVTLTGGCGTTTATGTITVTPDNTIILTSAVGTNNQTKCINSAITTITYTTTGASGATFIGLPTGVTGSWLANVITISGTPSISGIFNYSITLTGGCGTISANGTITVSPNNTIILSSLAGTNIQTRCINNAITTITYTTTGATGATFIGLPTGVTGSWSANVVTISGTPSVSGIYNYTVTLTGNCGIITENGTITVTPDNTIALTSAVGTDNQILCINTAITTITYTTTGATGATFIGLPAGISGSWLANVVTISGIPTANGIFSYSVVLSGGCGTITANGTITVNQVTAATIFVNGAISVCQNAADETYFATATNSTSIVYSVLPLTAGLINASSGIMNWNATFTGTATITANSTGLCGTTFADRIVTVKPLPIANASSNSPVCINSSIILSAQTVTGGNYSWTGPNAFSATVQNPVILGSTSANAGNYSLTVTENGCTSEPSIIAVIVNICPADLSIAKTVNNINPNLGHDVVFTVIAKNNGPHIATGVIVNEVLQSGFTYVSAITTHGIYNPTSGVWTIGNLNSGSTEILTITATVNINGSYINTAIISGNEADNDLTNNISTITLYPISFFIPEGFSPNGDGINDVFVITGIQNYPKNTFTIFNRWGNKVFEASPYLNNWDGSSKYGLQLGGDALPTSTYFYLLDLGNSSEVIKGTIYLNR